MKSTIHPKKFTSLNMYYVLMKSWCLDDLTLLSVSMRKKNQGKIESLLVVSQPKLNYFKSTIHPKKFSPRDYKQTQNIKNGQNIKISDSTTINKKSIKCFFCKKIKATKEVLA